MWGGLLGIKRADRGKKKFRGARNFRGGLFGEMPKKGWKNFLVVPKSAGIFLGVTTIFWGRIFREKKKKSPGAFSGNLKKKNLGGIF